MSNITLPRAVVEQVREALLSFDNWWDDEADTALAALDAALAEPDAIARAVEAEREACAKIADSQINNTAILLVNPGKSAAAWDIANAIRARGSK